MTTWTECTDQTANGIEEANWSKLRATVRRYCLALTGTSWDAEDLAQETLLKAIQPLRENGHANPEAYLITIAKRTWIDQTRRKSALARIREQQEQQQAAAWPADGKLEIETALQALMKHMPPLQRTVFMLRDVLGYSIAEAADILKTTEGAVKAAHHRARHSLTTVKEELERDGLPLPEDERSRRVLRALTHAYEAGNVAELIAITLSEPAKVEPAAAVVARMRRSRQTARTHGIRSALRMAA
ncbi:MAG: hypothetical protein K0Q59_1954 [Paenibacillus sp.]|nr:hypothetical protein [Paenibacillus sp.]